jgi:hypothetical protein
MLADHVLVAGQFSVFTQLIRLLVRWGLIFSCEGQFFVYCLLKSKSVGWEKGKLFGKTLVMR